MQIVGTEEAKKEFFAALAKAQGMVENATKTASNPHFRSKYADLAEIINTVRPVFTAHGMSIIQSPSLKDGICSVETVVLHTSGAYLSDICSAPVSKMDAQGVGSVTTYLRRYSLAAFCFIAQEDDDGNAASKPKTTFLDTSRVGTPEYYGKSHALGQSASVAKSADAADSKPAGETREGSTPSAGTTKSSDSPAGTLTPQPDSAPDPTHAFTVKDWTDLAVARKATSGIIGREISDEDLTDFGHFRFGKDSKKLWSKKEYDLCKAWLRTMYKEKTWVDYKTEE